MISPQGVRSNLPRGRLKWSTLRASQEFCVASDITLAARLRDAGESPDPESGTWTTQQIVSALFGNLHAQKLRKTRAEDDKVELANAITRAEYVNREELEQLHAAVAVSIRTIIRSSQLSREAQDDVLRSIAGIKIRVAGIAAAQRRGMNGEASGSGDGVQEARRKRGRPRKVAKAQPAAAAAYG